MQFNLYSQKITGSGALSRSGRLLNINQVLESPHQSKN